MKLRKNKNFFRNRQSLICTIKQKWKSLATVSALTLVHSKHNRISQVIKSNGDYITLMISVR